MVESLGKPYTKVSACGNVDFACVFCSYRPTNSILYSPLLHDFLCKDPSDQYRDLFQTLGITTDCHLRILLGMNEDDRASFLGRYVPSRLTSFGYVQLQSWIEDFRSVKPHGVEISMMPLKRKHERLEAFLAMPSTCPKLVARTMRLSVEEYQACVDRVQRELSNQGGCEEIVEEICRTFPVIAAYEEAWPVRLILKRSLAKPSKDYKFQSRSFESCSLRASLPTVRMHKCARLAQYWNYDGPNKVAPAAKKLLSFLRMEEELAPALWFLGVDTDARYEKVKSYREGDKKYEFLRAAEKLELNPIQGFMLKTIFEY